MGTELQGLVEKIYSHYSAWLRPDDAGLKLIDPVDNCVIGFHYGETHLGTAFIVYGSEQHNAEIEDCGRRIIKSFMAHAEEYQRKPAYHWDFNNFALCYLIEYLETKGELDTFGREVKNFVLKQEDSNNITINWQPMRVYVNQKKCEWTGEKKYLAVINKCKNDIERAQYEDGFFEDLLPKGKSFNFQYHIYTTAVLAFLNLRNIRIANLDNAIAQAVALMDPNGDINYLGRGNNQIFAWGPAIYLYSLLNDSSPRDRAANYVYGRASKAIDNDNLILNDYQGIEKVWWWDYHYSSVYIAHFAFWIALTLAEKRKLSTSIMNVKQKDSGVHIYSSTSGYVVTFDGRKHYLAEAGKVIANITTTDGHVFFKGAFGPYYKEYGYKYGNPTASIHNFIGLISERNMLGKLVQNPLFPSEILVDDNLQIILKYKKTCKFAAVNLPWMGECLPVVKDENGEEIKLFKVLEYHGPYGDTPLYQSRPMNIRELVIETKHKLL